MVCCLFVFMLYLYSIDDKCFKKATLILLAYSKICRMLDTCSVFVCLIMLGILTILFLFIHHKYKHSDPDDEANFIQDPCEQWFQYKLYPHGDVCNFKTCSHEMWIIAIAIATSIVSILYLMDTC